MQRKGLILTSSQDTAVVLVLVGWGKTQMVVTRKVTSASSCNIVLFSLTLAAQHFCSILSIQQPLLCLSHTMYKPSHNVNEPLHIDELATSLS